MASRNTIRQFDTEAIYHIYNRGVEKRQIFRDSADYQKFLDIMARHLDGLGTTDKMGRAYPQYESIEVLAYCLMPNHFHLLIYQDEDAQAFSKLLRSVSTAYTMYFNRKYNRVGHLFQDRFKAALVTSDAYYQHISRYIHLNPSNPFTYQWSSLANYLGKSKNTWVKPARIMAQFRGPGDYEAFVRDYESRSAGLASIKHLLADR